MRRRTAALATVLVLAAVSTTGCKALEEKFVPPPKVVTEDATVAVDGAQVAGELSKETPQGLPLWPGSEVIESTGTEDAYGLTLLTRDPFEDVLNGVAVGFEQAGWGVAREDAGDAGAPSVVLTVSNDTLEGFVTISQIETETTQLDYVITAVQ